MYTAYIREIHDCGYRSKNFVVVSTPPYFTPNNDGINDFWSVKGLQYYPKATTVIFDRNGQLITTLTQNNLMWDGTFHNEKLPSTDYWFISEIPETQQIIKGHFSLIR
jgi:gliding motility-associated-like protein